MFPMSHAVRDDHVCHSHAVREGQVFLTGPNRSACLTIYVRFGCGYKKAGTSCTGFPFGVRVVLRPPDFPIHPESGPF